MKKILILMVILLVAAGSVFAAEEATEILKKVKPSVVKVVAESHRRYVVSGFVVAPEYIITSKLITRYPYKKLYVISTDGKKIEAENAGVDQTTSLQLLKLKKGKLTPVKRGRAVGEGEWVAAIGSFYDRLPAIAQGIITSVSDMGLIMNLPAPPGASGSGVFNKKGELVGFLKGQLGFSKSHNYRIAKGDSRLIVKSEKNRLDSLSFGVPVNKMTSVYEELKRFGKVRKGWLGIELDALNPLQNVITSVTAGSPADKYGIKPGDKLVRIDNNSIRTRLDIVKSLSGRKPGEKLDIVVARKESELKINVELGENTSRSTIKMSFVADTMPVMKEFNVELLGTPELGAEFITLTPYVAESFGVKGGKGVIVSKVHSHNGKSNLKLFDVVVEVSGKKVNSPKELEQVVRSSGKTLVELKCIREGRPVTIKLPKTSAAGEKIKKQKLREFFTVIADKAGVRASSDNDLFWETFGSSKDSIDKSIKFLEIERDRIIKRIEHLRKLKQNKKSR